MAVLVSLNPKRLASILIIIIKNKTACILHSPNYGVSCVSAVTRFIKPSLHCLSGEIACQISCLMQVRSHYSLSCGKYV